MNANRETSVHDEDRHGVAVFVSLVAVIVAVAHYLLRWGLEDNEPGLVLRVIFLAFFILLLPRCCELCLSYWFKGREETWHTSHPAFSLFAVVLVILSGMAQHHLSIDLGQVICAVGVGLFILVLVTWLLKTTVRDGLLLVAASFLMGVFAVACFYSDICHQPLIVEAIAVGRTHLDLLCAAATTNMIKTYGIPSTGLDGIPYYSYHWGSWWVFAQFCKLLKVGSLRFLSLGFPVIFFPLLLQSMLVFAAELNRRSPHVYPNPPLVSNATFWMVTLVSLAGFVPRQLQSDVMMGPSGIGSESYAVALTFAFMAFTLSLFLVSKFDQGGRRWTRSELVLLWLVAPALLGLLTLTKLSIGFIVAGVYGYFGIRFGLCRSIVFATSLALCAISTLVVVKYTLWPSNLSGRVPTAFYPFHFLLTYVQWQMWFAFILGHFFWSWLFILAALYEKGIRSVKELREAFVRREMLDVETVVFICVVSAAPGLLLAIGDRNAVYFSDFQSWVSIAFILGSVDRLRSSLLATNGVYKASSMAPKRIAVQAFVYATVAVILLGVVYNVSYRLATMVYFNLSFRSCLCNQKRVESSTEIGCGGKAWSRALLSRLLDSARGTDRQSLPHVLREELEPLFTNVQEGLERGKAYRMIALLEELGTLPVSEKKSLLLFIPQNNEAYWKLIEPHLVMALDYPGCKAVPFIAPALTGIASLDGMPALGCDTTVYGFDCYARRTLAQTLSADNDIAICARARSKGFFKVLVVASDRAGSITVRRLNCCSVEAHHDHLKNE
jgi:hypothetical protein